MSLFSKDHIEQQSDLLLYKEIIKNVAEGIYLVSTKDLTIRYANPKFLEMFGYETNEIIGKHVSIINAPTKTDPMKVAVEIAKTLESEGYWQGEVLNIKKNGDIFWCNVAISSFIHKVYGEIYISIQSDITSQKKDKEELEKHRDHLSDLVDERTKELKKSHLQLIHSEKLASLGKLTGSISHEFNNPLQGIRTAINILSKSAPSEKEVSLAIAGKKECDRMAKMIKGLRDFYKPTTDKVIFIHINQCIEEVLALQIVSLREKGIRTNQQFSDRIPLIEVVEDQIKQVLLNLIQNAADSISDEGQVTLTTEKQGSNIVIKIQDTGSGISEDDQKNLFEPFYSTKEGKGTGLGLSISYGIIQDHGGEIEVESELGNGATFTISLPVNRE
jgi:PAS domain S-box-containing protein